MAKWAPRQESGVRSSFMKEPKISRSSLLFIFMELFSFCWAKIW